jgi:hypothetical protein
MPSSASRSIVSVFEFEHLGDVECLQVQLHLAGLDLGEVQHLVDEPQQVLAGRADLLEVGHERAVSPSSSASSMSISL